MLNKSFHKSGFLVLFLFALSLTGSAHQDNKGNPLPHFLFPKFKDGIIIMKDGAKFDAVLNYNMVDERMITEVDGMYRYSKNPQKIERIIIDNRTFIPFCSAFYEIVTSGNVTIFIQNRSNLTPKGNDTGYGFNSKSVGPVATTRFELTPVTHQYQEVAYIDLPQNVEVTPASVFWVSMGDKLEDFSTEKQFTKLFPEYSAQLKEYIRKEGIKIKNREDLIKLGVYCNEIMTK